MYLALLFLLVGFAAAEDECKDVKTDCASKKMMCNYPGWKDYFKKNCAKTCGFCHSAGDAKCGKPEIQGIRVIAGKTAVRGSWPWQILMLFAGRAGCGGTLISPKWVVTAAHCVYGKEKYPYMFKIRVGEHDTRVKEGSEVDHKVKHVFRHMKYDPRHLNNDIALFELEKPVKFNKYVKPACLPSRDPPVGTKCYLTGWGKVHHPGDMTPVLQQGVLPVVSNKVCYEKNHKVIPIPITDAMICGGDGGATRLSGCHGDSGGPYVCNINGVWELHGSVSHGSPVCESSQSYTVFSRTYHFKDWIHMFTGL